MNQPFIILLAVALFAADARAQVPTLNAGSRVRVQPMSDSNWIKGKVAAQSGDTLTLARSGNSVAIGLASINAIDVSLGRSRWLGAGVGLFAGMGVGAIAGALSPKPENPGIDPVAPAAAGAFAGAVLGSIVGAVIGVERWRPVYRNGISLSLRPAARDGVVSWSLRF